MSFSLGRGRWQPNKRRLIAGLAYGLLMAAALLWLQDRRLLIATLAVLAWFLFLSLRVTPQPAPAPWRRDADLETDNENGPRRNESGGRGPM